jgi:hypothetical protein
MRKRKTSHQETVISKIPRKKQLKTTKKKESLTTRLSQLTQRVNKSNLAVRG